MAADRSILHVDMDAFFAAIAVRDDPSLRGKAVLTGGDGPRGVVTTASYEARKFGCHSAMPMAQAKRLCPHATVVKVPGEKIRAASRGLFAILDDFSPIVQPLSVDEAFLDVTGQERLMGDPVAIARRLKQRVRDELRLTASVGVSFNKFLAKLASDLEKPDGLTVIDRENLDRVLPPLPVSKIWGVGPATQRSLERRGIRTVADLRRHSLEQLRRAFGDFGERFYRLSRGIDDRPVTPDRTAKRIGQERPFGQDLADPDGVRIFLREEVEQVARRVRKHGFKATGVTVKIRFGDFQTITRSTALDRPTDLTDDLWRAARGLFDRWAAGAFQPVRLIGATAVPLKRGDEQLDLFADPSRDKRSKVDQTLDRIADRFGKHAIHRGAGRPAKPLLPDRPM